MIEDLKKQKQKKPQTKTTQKNNPKQEELIYNTQYAKEKIKFQGATVTIVLDLLSPKD